MKLKKFRERYRLSTKDIVDELSKTYPKYTKGINSMAEHPERYGLQLEPKAVKLLKVRFAPVRSECAGGAENASKKRVANETGAAVKLGTAQLRELNFLMQRTGTKTKREMLEKIINAAYREGEKEEC